MAPSSHSDQALSRIQNMDALTEEVSTLASLGQYREIVDKMAAVGHSVLPHLHLTYLTFSLLSLFKLKKYSLALDHLNSLDSDFDHFRYESYPSHYPNRTGSMVPFALRWFHAVLPDKIGQRNLALDRLYVLLDFVRTKINTNNEKGPVLWRRREVFVLGSIVSIHLAQKEFTVALGLMEGMVGKGDMKELDAVMVSKVGYVQMQIGDLEGANATFSKVERMVEDKLGEVWVKNLLGRNKALGYLVGKDYLSAVREYEECVERDAKDVVAVNNKAICLMYLRELSGSITVLEGALERVPTVALNEPLVVNLCSMYELAYVNHLDIKRTLSNWIAQIAPDDFDTSCTRV